VSFVTVFSCLFVMGFQGSAKLSFLSTSRCFETSSSCPLHQFRSSKAPSTPSRQHEDVARSWFGSLLQVADSRSLSSSSVSFLFNPLQNHTHPFSYMHISMFFPPLGFFSLFPRSALSPFPDPCPLARPPMSHPHKATSQCSLLPQIPF